MCFWSDGCYALRPLPVYTSLTCAYLSQNFVVRQSSKPSTMALSVRLPVEKGPYVEHYLIETVGEAQLRLEGSDNNFHAIPMLVAHYCQCWWEIPCYPLLARNLPLAAYALPFLPPFTPFLSFGYCGGIVSWSGDRRFWTCACASCRVYKLFDSCELCSATTLSSLILYYIFNICIFKEAM